ncbi:MAG: UDP-N-acetylmuramate--L-alanine ligase [Clostridia bacterium]|nr:UDP-N-acetylmuramate--L-alanine ligase [Clostridia bacterium]
MQKVHMLGIGGAGMAGLAQLLHQKGVRISGSDREKSTTAQRLTEQGIPVFFDDDPTPLWEADQCIYSAAIEKSHPLRRKAEARMPTLSRGEAMGLLSRSYSTVAAVAGTHGKTTVTGMLTQIVQQSGNDPSVLIGGHLPSIDGNGHHGRTDLLICEACEFAGSFLHLKRNLGILLNVDNDHLECYGSMEGLKNAFQQFTDGCDRILVYSENEAAMEVTAHHPHRFTYGQQPTDHFRLLSADGQNGFYTVTLQCQGQSFSPIRLCVPGFHNALNALAAAGAALLLGCKPESVSSALASFSGVKRRFEIRYRDEQVVWADDYAHHPQEIAAVLTAAKQMGFSRVTALFQPFTYSRTKLLAKEFAHALRFADQVILTPVMGGREPYDPDVTAQTISRYLPNAQVGKDFSQCAELAATAVQKGELILTMGCGNVYRCGEMIELLLKDRYDFHKIT